VLAHRGPPFNDRCVDAAQFELSYPIDGSNINVNFDFPNQAVCGPKSEISFNFPYSFGINVALS
jgi:hypothetical protein